MSDRTIPTAMHQYQRTLNSLPEDWELKEIRQLGTILGGGTPSRDVPSFWNGTIPWITPGEVRKNSGKVLVDSNEYISKSGLDGSGANLLPTGSLMVTTRATLGACAINGVEMATNQGFKSIAFNEASDAAFYLYFFEKLQPEVTRLASGTTFLEISGSDFSRIQVPSPFPKEKLLVSKVLETIDTAIRETEAVITKLKAVKQGLLHDLLTRGIDANGELRPLQSEAPQRYKMSPLGWIPKEWEILSGSSVCKEIVVGIVIRPTQYYRPEGIPVLRSANVRENSLSQADLTYMSAHDHRNLSKSAVRPGDVLTVRTGYPGTSCVVDESILEANCVDILISRPSEQLDPEFWSRWINSERGKNQVLAAQGGLAQQHFNVGDLQRLLISLPDLSEQVEISTRLLKSEMAVGAEIQSLSALNDLKTALMDDLLTGRVRVTPLLEAADA